MTNLEHQQHIVNLLVNSLAGVCEASRIEQKMSHAPNSHPRYRKIQEKLECLLDTERALLTRMKTVGR